jgi:four helix bundle protein
MEDWLVEEGNIYLDINDISAYKVAFTLSNYVWEIIIKWNYFEKDTVGKQFVRAIDSISANLAEGFGRFGKKDKIHFYRYSYGSLKESQDWNEKAKIRNLLSKQEYDYISKELDRLPREINYLIKFTDEKLKY